MMDEDILGQDNIIEGYNKTLQEQNLAKIHQIEQLKREMQLITLSSRLQALNTQKTCKQCVRKDQQIQTLIKALKLLRTSATTASRTTIKQTAQNQNQVIAESEQNQFEKRVCFESKQIGGIKSINNILQMNKSMGTLLSGRQGSKLSQQIKQENKTYIEDIILLKNKIYELEKKIIVLQQTNGILREQLKAKSEINSSSERFHDYGLKKVEKTSTPVASLASDDLKTRLPTFSAIRTNVTKNTIKKVDNLKAPSLVNRTKQQKSYASSSKLNGTIRYNSPLQTLVQKSPNTFKLRQDDMIQERRKSLNRKIRILQSDNAKLRNQMYSLNH